MVVKFKRLELHNFASYKDVTLDLSDMGYTLVSGRNYCKLDNAYSNGSGKSSIFNGLCYALTGETTQGITNGFENIFSDPNDCWVRLTMEADDDEFIIQRIKTPKQNLRLWLNGDEISGKGIRESSKVLATHLPDLTTDLVNGIIILGQGLPRRFTNNKPSHRKELLENLTKSDFMIQSIKDKLEARMTDLKLHLREDEDSLLENNSQLKVYEKQLAEYNNDLKLYSEYPDLESIEERIKYIDETYAQLDLEFEGYQNEANNLEKKKAEIENDKSQQSAKLISIYKDPTYVEIEKKRTDIEKEYIMLTAEVKSVEKAIKDIESIVDICPTCGQKIPEVNKPSTDKEVQKLKELSVKSTEILAQKSSCLLEKEEFTRDYNKKYQDKIDEDNKSLKSLGIEMAVVNNNMMAVAQEKSNLSTEKIKLSNLRDNYSKLTKNIKKTEKSINSINKSISKINVDITVTRSRLDILQQMLTLAKREFRGILLSNVIEYINRKVKKYSMEVFGNDELSFKLNDNYIDITYCDKLYENLSGGEKQKIDVIVQLALRDILSRQLNIHFNVLVLDEIYDGLDTISCQKITNLVSNLSDIDSIFVISHHVQDLEITYDNNLLVEKDEDGISTITFE